MLRHKALLTVLVAIALFAVLADSAQACNRCGLFGRRCRYSSNYYYPAAVAQQVAYPQQVINISNVYPQGSTVYSAGQVAQLYATDTNLAITSASRVAGNAVEALTAAMQLGEANIGQVAEVAKLQAATEHLRAAMNSGSGGQSQALTLRIVQSGGGIKVEQVTDGQTATPPPLPGGDGPTAPAVASMLAQKCAKCHGASLPQPKGGLFFDAGVQLSSNQSMRALKVLAGRDVPEPMRPLIESLTAQEKGALMEELLTLHKEEE